MKHKGLNKWLLWSGEVLLPNDPRSMLINFSRSVNIIQKYNVYCNVLYSTVFLALNALSNLCKCAHEFSNCKRKARLLETDSNPQPPTELRNTNSEIPIINKNTLATLTSASWICWLFLRNWALCCLIKTRLKNKIVYQMNSKFHYYHIIIYTLPLYWLMQLQFISSSSSSSPSSSLSFNIPSFLGLDVNGDDE